ncbi:hypothetical protein [Saccharopolyspora pogona]|uniref:hypothetical protein n=1 Tax=Saccharopolyspora pogona TaxID=333966 RepID=UPI0016892C6B|nr:hypothetical protein [Saccharopolyspora pogona]
MSRTTFTANRYTALDAVNQGKICYHNGLLQPALGYDWVMGISPMADDLRQTLRDLWVTDLIDIDTHRLFALRGHRVVITTKGYRTLRDWSALARGEWAA